MDGGEAQDEYAIFGRPKQDLKSDNSSWGSFNGDKFFFEEKTGQLQH